MLFGTAVHEVFEQVAWWSPSQALTGDKEATAVVQECLSVPEILELFTAHSPSDEVLRELPLEFIEGEKWWTGIMDRLVLRKNDAGEITRAVVVDFKTDNVDTLEVLHERYQGQLGVYRRALAVALKLDTRMIELTLLSTHLKSLLRI
jgi:ATP-dependent exoDNAse (exonuclease V) beta subunit